MKKQEAFSQQMDNDKSLVIAFNAPNQVSVLTDKQGTTVTDVLRAFNQVPATERKLFIRLALPGKAAEAFADLVTELVFLNRLTGADNDLSFANEEHEQAVSALLTAIYEARMRYKNDSLIGIVMEAEALELIGKAVSTLADNNIVKLKKANYLQIMAIGLNITEQVHICVEYVKEAGKHD